jgi:hypothetical protein
VRRVIRVDVITEIVIDVPRKLVSSYAADPINAPQWYANIESVEWVTPPPPLVGARAAFVAHFLGRHLTYTYDIVGAVLGEQLVMRTAQGRFPMETTYTWQDHDGGTKMTLRNRGEPSGFFTIGSPLLAAAVRRANRQDLARLKALLEQRRP